MCDAPCFDPSDDSFVQVKTYRMTRQPTVWLSLHDTLGDGAEDLGSAQHEKRVILIRLLITSQKQRTKGQKLPMLHQTARTDTKDARKDSLWLSYLLYEEQKW
jgi:hypothetical protein